jgi:hypothetical protein
MLMPQMNNPVGYLTPKGIARDMRETWNAGATDDEHLARFFACELTSDCVFSVGNRCRKFTSEYFEP